MTKTLKKGFTLVELIVVIAIIAILATVSVVGYSAFIENANQSKVNQELAQAENVLRAEAVATVTVSLPVNVEKDEDQTLVTLVTLVMSLEDSKIKFTFSRSQSATSETLENVQELLVDEEVEDVQQLLVEELIDKVELSTLEGKFTLTDKDEETKKAKLTYTLGDLSATLDVVLDVVAESEPEQP